MTARPRTSTLVLAGLFIGVLALYILFRPDSGSAQTVPATTPAHSTHPPSPSTSPHPSASTGTPTPTAS